jgi:hypothetical protein
MTTEQYPSLESCVLEVTEAFESVQICVRAWIDTVLDTFLDEHPQSAELDSVVEQLVRPELAENPDTVIGAGFVATPGVLDDAPWHLAWWLGARNTFEMSPGTPSIRRLLTVDDPSADGFRDYTSLEWWRVPAETGHAHVTGPYVDYLCTDDYTMTLTVPMYLDDELIGMMGADQYVTDIERRLMPVLRETGLLLTLVNSTGRVVLSTDPSIATGTLLRLPGFAEVAAGESSRTELGSGDVVYRCGRTTLMLVEHAPMQR